MQLEKLIDQAIIELKTGSRVSVDVSVRVSDISIIWAISYAYHGNHSHFFQMYNVLYCQELLNSQTFYNDYY